MKTTWGEMAELLRTLQSILSKPDANLGLLLEMFWWFPFFCGIKYFFCYEPHSKANRERNSSKGHAEPMYRMPLGMAFQKASQGGRCYSRCKIGEGHLLDGKGLVLAWVAPVDVSSCRSRARASSSSGTEP